MHQRAMVSLADPRGVASQPWGKCKRMHFEELRGGRCLPSSPGMFTQVHLRTPLAMVDIQLLQGSTPGSINRVYPPESPLGQGHRPFLAEVLRSPLLSFFFFFHLFLLVGG
ncbi:unnamed protein product [Rangifer tarandus platyrhynchus]|uniref:Uncharacterized protein n=2 Tax=Rangifer tarandus platyrhynchus TaxID=3082113 RepID=A0AC59YNY6_RANTA|nr:unnamed protein product [Rangifer tarandus platyrhynchus]